MAELNRETWLNHAAEAMKPWLEEIENVEVPKLWVSVGFGSRSSAVGNCHPRSNSEDGINHIFISPVRGAGQSVDALGTLLHEMIHAADDCESGHLKNFVRIAKAVGFIPKWTSSQNRTDALTERLEGLVERLGPLPHGALGTGRAADQAPKQGTRMLKAECAGGTGYKVRLSQKWIDEYGAPICPCCTVEMELA